MKKVWIALLGIFVIFACFKIERVHSSIADSVIRLHILANSDSVYDQEQKLKVRDFVLEKYGKKLSADTREEALEKIYSQLPQMLKDIKAVSGQEVKISVKESFFPTKDYGNFSFPTGKYLALKIELGKGEGKNWWCVMYPPLCFREFTAVSDLGELKKVLSPEEYELVTKENKKVLYKFKAVEVWNSIKQVFN